MERDVASGSKLKLKRPPYYMLRRPNQATQTSVIQKPPPRKLDSTVQVWIVKESKKDKMAQLLNRSVQCIAPSVPKSLIIIILLTALLCGMAAYITRGNLYDPLPSAHGQGSSLRNTLVDITWAIVKPFIGLFAKT